MSDKDLPEGVYTKFDQTMSYTDYLSLSTLLNAQNPIMQEDDESWLFTN